MQESIVKYCGDHEKYKCGYCHNNDTNYSHGLWAYYLTVEDYQNLIDRGWRRSGKYCYKPTMNAICCPMYTIRCRALEFKASKTQKKVLKRMNKFLSGQESEKNTERSRRMSTSSPTTEHNEEESADAREVFVKCEQKHEDIDLSMFTNSSVCELKVENTTKEKTSVEIGPSSSQQCDTEQKPNMAKDQNPNPEKAQIKKAKQLRLERKLDKLKQKGIDISTINKNFKSKEKQIKDFINELPEEFKERLKIKLVRTTPPSREWLATSEESFKLYSKYQIKIHKDLPEDCTKSGFNSFLVESPLIERRGHDCPPSGYGSFHQQYWLDDKLIAVGVIDILPKCVSSVYFFYDPDYSFLSMGTYGALREIELTRDLNATCTELKYYYMGFYIHSCQKMRYKGKFHPSDLACPETYKWFPLSECVPKLEKHPYSRLDPDLDSIDEDYPTENDIKKIQLWNRGKIGLYRNYRGTLDKEDIIEYSRLVGGKACRSLIFII